MLNSMKTVQTDKAPAAIGPYAQAVQSGGFLFTSGQIALDPTTMEIVDGGVEAQTQQVLANLEAVLTEAGLTKTNVIKTTIFLANMDDFTTVNQVYGDFFGDHKPARSTVEVSRLPKDVLVEIELVAEVS